MSYDSMLQQALKLHQQGKLDEAETLYRQILQTTPEHPKVLNLLGLIAQGKGLHSEAINCFEKAIINDSENFELFFNLGWSLSALAKYHEALEAYRKVLKIKPDTKEAYLALGETYALLGQKDKAAEMFEKALVFAPKYVEAEINLAYLNQDIKKLLQLYNEQPGYPSIAYYLSLLYRNQGDIQTALRYAVKAADGTTIEGYQLLAGELYLQQSCNDAAAAFFCEALELNPRSLPALINLANIETDSQAAEKMYKQAIDIDTQDFDAHLNYAVFLHRHNRLPEALEEYRKAVIINPQSSEVSANLGTLHRSLGETEQALDLFFNAFNLDKNNRQYALNIAETLVILYRQSPDKAIKIAANWLQYCPDNPFAKHLNASFKGENIGNDTQYSQELFDIFADNYEHTMRNLNYNLPEQFVEFIGQPAGLIIDLGCGTGLLGEKLKTSDNRLIGVDISAEMLAKAADKNVYEQLVQSDIIEYCPNIPPQAFVVAADVIGYIGDIKTLVQQVFPRKFAFSAAINDNSVDNFKLDISGRYVYNSNYISAILTQTGYTDISSQEVVLRTENDSDVNGIIFYAKEKTDEPKN